jgi:hypothetical protein
MKQWHLLAFFKSNKNGLPKSVNLQSMKFTWIVLLGLFLYSCSSSDEEKRSDIFFSCSAEEVKDGFLKAGDYDLEYASTRSKDQHRTGEYSVKISKDSPYSFTYAFKDVKKGDVISASVFRYKKGAEGFLVIAGDSTFSSNNYAVYNEANWGKIETNFVADRDFKELKVYVFNPEDDAAYFDDLEVKAYFNTKKPEGLESLMIELSDGALDTLSNYRDIALEQDLITGDLKEYVNATVKFKGKDIPVKIRLKGDWTDHLKTDKWSFRIKVRGDNSILGLKTFSIQNPSTRGYLREWFAHKVFEREDILTTTYKFIPVYINGENKGVYALEEHFDKQLLESRNRREGPIVKFNEEGVWQQNLALQETGKYHEAPAFESAEILPFKKNRTYRTPTLRNQFYVAKSHMQRYRIHDSDLSSYMDVNTVAKFLALSDILNGKHGMEWHNQRMYYNPVTCKLEFIAFDCYTDPHTTTLLDPEIFGIEASKSTHFEVQEFLVNHPEVKGLYLKYLKEYTDPHYLVKVFDDLNREIVDQEIMLGYEYPFAKLERSMFVSNASIIQGQLEEYEKINVQNIDETDWKQYDPLPPGQIFTEIALKANVREGDSTYQVIDLTNHHSHDITITAYTVKGAKDSLISLSRKLTLGPPADPNVVKSIPLRFEGIVRRIYYTEEHNGDSLFAAKPSKWMNVDLLKTSNDKEDYSGLPFREIDGVLHLFKGGRYRMTKDVVIPEGKLVRFEAGVQIDITNGASFVSYSPVRLNGAENGKIKITSSDNSAGGFNVIAPGTKSKMKYVEFDGMNSMNRSDWTLTGAVTFYESEITIDNCSFTNNHCEDGLNLIRCDFKMSNSEVSNTYSDGFDADFCTGTLELSKFSDTGNDCIDFSGSQITVKNCTVTNAGDKGISGGEGSELKVENCTIDGAHIAIASKDLSKVTVDKVYIAKAKYGFAAYRKKPEYGPGKIVVNSVKQNKAEILHLLEEGSTLNYMNKEFEGTKKFNIDSMYMAYSK